MAVKDLIEHETADYIATMANHLKLFQSNQRQFESMAAATTVLNTLQKNELYQKPEAASAYRHFGSISNNDFIALSNKEI